MYGQNFPVVQERRISEIEKKLEDIIRRLDEMESSKITSKNIATAMKEQSDEIVASTAIITEELVIKPKSTKKKNPKKKKN